MALKAMNVKLEESKILDIKNVAAAFHLSMTDVFNNALDKYLAELKSDPFYKLTMNIEEASSKESEEILKAIKAMSDDDLAITTAERFKI